MNFKIGMLTVVSTYYRPSSSARWRKQAHELPKPNIWLWAALPASSTGYCELWTKCEYIYIYFHLLTHCLSIPSKCETENRPDLLNFLLCISHFLSPFITLAICYYNALLSFPNPHSHSLYLSLTLLSHQSRACTPVMNPTSAGLPLGLVASNVTLKGQSSEGRATISPEKPFSFQNACEVR